MKSCILSDRLYVPEEYVKPKHLAEFCYSITQDDTFDYGPFETGVGSIRTFTKKRLADGQIYYGFARGNMQKIGRLFGDLPWSDQTTAPPLQYDIKFNGKLYTYENKKIGQQEAADQWLRCKNGILRANPRFGKTITSIYLITKMGVKTLIVTHQWDLLEQYYKSFSDFTNIDEIREPLRKKRDARGQVFGYFTDYDNPEELDVCLLCWQTFASKAKGDARIDKYKKTWGMVIVDECHRIGGIVFAKTVNRLSARYRMGLTGTVERTDGREFLVKDILGTVSAEGKVATVDCKVTVIHTGVSIKYGFSEPLVYLHKRLYNAAGRMQLVLKYAMKDIDAGRFICMAFHSASIEQLKHWTSKLQFMGVSAEAFYGSCVDREGVLDRARSGETQVLVCNRQMLTGIDIPRWDTFYNLFPSSNVVFNDMGELSGNYYQEFSRIRTPYTDKITGTSKKEGIIRDFVDKNPFCYGSYRKRYKAYVQQQFNIDIIKEEGATNARTGKGLDSR